MMQARWLALAALVVLSACGSHEEHAKEKAADDKKDIAMVERMSKAPFKPILPKPITRTDLARYGLAHRGCLFTAKGGKDPIFVAGPDEGFMHIGRELGRYAAKTESAQFAGKAHATYIGLENWIDIIRLPDEGTGGDAVHWPARIMLHDAQERVAFMADGMMDCGQD